MNQHRRPIWFAALVTALSVPFFLALLSALAIRLLGGLVRFEDWTALTGLIGFVLPITYVAIFVGALPYILWLRARRELIFPYVCTGTTIASLFAVPAYGLLAGPQVAASGISSMLAASVGLLSGIVFCIAAGIAFRSSGRRFGAA